MKVFCSILYPVLFSAALFCAVLGLDTAFVEVVIYEQSGGDYTTYTYKLKGHFSDAGAATSAEGDILEVQPSGLCNATDSSDIYEYGWVGVVKLSVPNRHLQPCLPLFEKAKRAIQRGATAVIFDTTDDPNAAEELNHVSNKIKRPVVLLAGQDANKLMNIVKNQKVARARIQYGTAGYTPQRASHNEYFDMVIFMTFFILVSIICFSLLLKIKWRQRQKESSLTRMALHALSRMETRKFHSTSMECVTNPEESGDTSDAGSITSHKEDLSAKCVICLERFKDGQDVRIVPCRHEFHKHCVDPWLMSNYTCPLCMLNIVEKEGCNNKPRRGRRWFTTRCGRCFSSSGSSSSTGSMLNFPIEMSLATSPSQEIPPNSDVYDGTTVTTSVTTGLSTSANVDLRSLGALSNSCPSFQMSERNCEGHCVYKGGSLRQSTPSLAGIHTYDGSPGHGKTYMHQVVVVAPMTGDMLDVSQEDIV